MRRTLLALLPLALAGVRRHGCIGAGQVVCGLPTDPTARQADIAKPHPGTDRLRA